MNLLRKMSMRNNKIIHLIWMLPILLICLIFNINNVFALETFYKNKNGVILTEEEYDFLTKMYWDGHQSLMTFDDYEEFKD